MKTLIKVLAAVAFVCFASSRADAQCTGQAPTSTFCGNTGAAQALPTFHAISDIVKSISPTQAPFNAKCDGTTDDAVALQAWLTYIGTNSKAGSLPAGTCITHSLLTGVSNTTISGAGKWLSTIKGVGTGANPVFFFHNSSKINFSDFTIGGNDAQTSWATSSDGAIAFSQDNAATGPGEQYNFRRMAFYGFNTNRWILFYNPLSIFTMSKVLFDDVDVISDPADIPTDAVAANNTNLWLQMQSGSAGNGQIYDVVFNNVRIYGANLCTGTLLYGNIANQQYTASSFLNIGSSSTPTHCINGFGDTYLSYGAAIYDIYSDGHPPRVIQFTGNLFDHYFAAGVYMAGDGDITHNAESYNDFQAMFTGNDFIGPGNDDHDGSLPRGAIAITNATNISGFGNRFVNNYGSVSAAAQFSGTINFSDNYCSTNAVSALGNKVSCFRFQPGAGTTTNTVKYIAKGNDLSVLSGSQSQVVRTFANTAYHYGEIDFSNNRVTTDDKGVDFSGAFVNTAMSLIGNRFAGTAATSMLDVSSVSGVTVNVKDSTFNLATSTTGTGLNANSSAANITNVEFANRTSGAAFALSATSATGTVDRIQFTNVLAANQVVAGSMGMAIPTWSAQSQSYVQNLSASAGSLINTGWLNTSAGVNWQSLNPLSSSTALSVISNATNAAAVPTAVAAASDDQVFRRSGTALAFGAVDLSKAAAITGVLRATSFPALTGDITTVAGALATTLATVNANVGTFGSATQCVTETVNAKGLITAVSAANCTPAASSITGGAALTKTDDTNVTLTLGGSPSTALLAAASITAGWTGTLANARLAAMATNTVKGNATSGSATPTDLAVSTCSTTASALIWTTNTGFGCNTSIVASSATTATTATNATNTAITDDTSTNATMYPTWVTANAGNLPQKVSSTKLYFNPSTSLFTVNGNTAAPATAFAAGTILGVAGPDAARARIDVDSYGTGAATAFSAVNLRRANGTAATPSAIQSGDLMFALAGTGYGTSFQDSGGAGMLGWASQTFTGAAGGTELAFNVTANGATTNGEVARFKNTGQLALTAAIASTSKTTGTVVVTGGLGVSGATFTDTLNIITPATDATHTDNTLCWDTTTGLILKGSGALGVCLGTSSARFKHDIVSMGAGLAEIVKLTPRNFFYNKGYGDDGRRQQYGFIAEEVIKALPGVTAPDAAGKPQSVDMLAMVPVLVKAVQELKVANDNLQTQVNALREARK